MIKRKHLATNSANDRDQNCRALLPSSFIWETKEDLVGTIHSSKISGNFGPKLNGSVRSNRTSFEKTGPPFEVVLFSRSDRSEILVEWIAPSGSLTSENLPAARRTLLYNRTRVVLCKRRIDPKTTNSGKLHDFEKRKNWPLCKRDSKVNNGLFWR